MKTQLIIAITSSTLLTVLMPLLAADTLIPQSPVKVTGTQGKFDFIKIDTAQNRLLACHTANGSLDVIDVATSKLIKSIPTGAAQGVAVDDKGGRYFVSVSKPPKMVIIDSTKLEVSGEVPLTYPADVMAYAADLDRAFVCNDEKPILWIIDPTAKTIVATLNMPGQGMEDLGFDDKGMYLYQCLKDSNELAQIDAKGQKVITSWPTAPAENPHGMAVVPGSHAALVVGGNGKLVLMDLISGKVLASCDVSLKVDEIAFDPGMNRVYCASGLGTISVVSLDQNRLTTLDTLPSSQGAHSIAVDPKTHTVWTAFVKDGKAYVQAFTGK
ncbi:MAG TPA: YncE family protein [Candidatus Methylacidiphilales bacterium]|jgi:DNA-binding beta-propeller fold protein YncE|nr:YncE family protein [Candidatus Methylacidiphilales bacterium]